MDLRRMKVWSPVFRVILVGFVAIAAAVPIFLFVATLPPGEQTVKGILESQLSSQLHQSVSIVLPQSLPSFMETRLCTPG